VEENATAPTQASESEVPPTKRFVVVEAWALAKFGFYKKQVLKRNYKADEGPWDEDPMNIRALPMSFVTKRVSSTTRKGFALAKGTTLFKAEQRSAFDASVSSQTQGQALVDGRLPLRSFAQVLNPMGAYVVRILAYKEVDPDTDDSDSASSCSDSDSGADVVPAGPTATQTPSVIQVHSSSVKDLVDQHGPGRDVGAKTFDAEAIGAQAGAANRQIVDPTDFVRFPQTGAQYIFSADHPNKKYTSLTGRVKRSGQKDTRTCVGCFTCTSCDWVCRPFSSKSLQSVPVCGNPVCGSSNVKHEECTFQWIWEPAESGKWSLRAYGQHSRHQLGPISKDPPTVVFYLVRKTVKENLTATKMSTVRNLRDEAPSLRDRKRCYNRVAQVYKDLYPEGTGLEGLGQWSAGHDFKFVRKLSVTLLSLTHTILIP
jgi:hypothetical protein